MHAAVPHAAINASSPLQQRQQAHILSGAGEGLPQASTVPAFCAPFDVNCWLSQAAQWIAQNIFNVLQPLIDAINQSSLNFITQTPSAGTYQNPTVIQFTTWSISVVNAAVAVFIIIAGYNIMIARQIGADYYELMEFLPRLALAVLAANFSLYFIRLFIDLENALNLGVINLFSLTILTNTIVGIFRGNLLVRCGTPGLYAGHHPGRDGSSGRLADVAAAGAAHLADRPGATGLSVWSVAPDPGLPAAVDLDLCSDRLHSIFPGIGPGNREHAHLLCDSC